MTSRNTTRIDVAALVSIIVAAIILLAMSATPADAQLGKIKKAVSKAVVPAAVAPSTPAGVRTGNVTFDERVLEITPQTLDRFMAGLDAEVEMAAVVNAQDLDAIDRENAAAARAHDQAMAAWDAERKQHEACSENISKDLGKQIEADKPAASDQAKMAAVAARVKAAKDAGNMAEVRRISDSLVAALNPANQRMVAASNNATNRVVSECGMLPPEPESARRKTALTWNDVNHAGAKASGMTMEQYMILRERVVPWVKSQGRSSDMMYTSSEVDALKSKSDALGKYGHVFGDM